MDASIPFLIAFGRKHLIYYFVHLHFSEYALAKGTWQRVGIEYSTDNVQSSLSILLCLMFFNEHLVPCRTVLFTLTSVVVLVITTDWISWDKLNRGFLPSDEVSRAFLASFILVFDLLIVMQVSVFVFPSSH